MRRYRHTNWATKGFDYFMIATPHDEETKYITEIYHEKIKENFTLKERSKYWSIYEKIKK